MHKIRAHTRAAARPRVYSFVGSIAFL